jgi:hypothetical protein
MSGRHNNFGSVNESNYMARQILTYVTIATFIALVAVLAWKGRGGGGETKEEPNGKISVTPTQIKSVKETGEWEFLTIDVEELADTTATRLIGSDRRLTRIYYGTLRLGIDLRKAADDWVKMDGDTVDVTLPHIIMLDKDFIDEAKTKAFYESGTWDQVSREALYQQARRKMLSRCLTTENINIAQLHAVEQMTKLFQAMGYPYVDVHF